MTSRTARRGAAALGISAALTVGLATAASAHVTADPSTAAAGSYAYVQFSVPHGCDGSATTALAIQIPDGVTSVKPELAPDWEITTAEGPVTPYESEGETVSTGITEVRWAGGSIPDDRLQRFGLSLKFPDAPGETLYFPVVQTCEQGETAWIEIPEAGAEEPEHPAPAVELTASSGGEQGDDATATTVAGTATTALAAGGDEQAAGASSGDGDDKDGTGLAVVALVVGGLGLLVGGFSLGRSFRRPS